jgi:hypothetical protein
MHPIIHNHILSQEFHNKCKYTDTFEQPDNLEIIICNNYVNKRSLFENNLICWGLNFTAIKKDIPEWRNIEKPAMIYEYLVDKQNKKELCLICDSDDVVITQSPYIILSKFYEFNCKMLFNASRMREPYDSCMPEQLKWLKATKRNHGLRYLNAGVLIGYTENIISLYSRVLDFVPRDRSKIIQEKQYKRKIKGGGSLFDYISPDKFPTGLPSDQDIIRYIEPEFYPDLQVDIDNIITYRDKPVK